MMELRSRRRIGEEDETKKNKLVLSECYGSSPSSVHKFGLSEGGELERLERAQTRPWPSLSGALRDLFLPAGYPESVSEDYLGYQCWDTVQAFASSLTGALATEAVLRGAGVGEAGASALATALTWLMKDGAGMVGRIGFAYARGSVLDADSKKWRLVADLLNDAAFFMDLLAPLAPSALFRYIVCLSSVLRSIVGVAGGATRAALTQHQARRNNLADVAAKDGSQETLVNLAALLVSFLLLQIVSGKFLLVWSLFCLFTALHLFANYRAVRALRLRTLNGGRARILVRGYIASHGKVLSPAAANDEEPILRAIFGGWSETSVSYGVSLACLFAATPATAGLWTQLASKRPSYVLRAKGGRIWVALAEGSDAMDLMEACLAAEFLAYHRARPKTVSEAVAWAEQERAAFVEGLRSQGWETEYTLLCPDEWRFSIS